MEGFKNISDLNQADYDKFEQLVDLIRNETSLRWVRDVLGTLRSLDNRENQLIAAGGDAEGKKTVASLASDNEARLAHGASGKSDISLGEQSKTNLQELALCLQQVGFIKIVPEKGISVRDSNAIPRFRDFLNVVQDNPNFKSIDKLSDHFSEATKYFIQNRVNMFKRQTGSGTDGDTKMVQTLSVNTLAFIATIVASKKGPEPWSNYIDPNMYQEPINAAQGLKNYNPKQAASDLIDLGFATTTESTKQITLNKKAIQDSVKRLQSEIEPMMKGATIERPTTPDKHLRMTGGEEKARQLIQYVSSNVSTDIKSLAENIVKTKLLKVSSENRRILNAYEERISRVNQSDDVTGPSQRRQQEELKRSNLVRAIDLAKSRVALRLMNHFANIILGKKTKGSIITAKDLDYITTAWESGLAWQRSKI